MATANFRHVDATEHDPRAIKPWPRELNYLDRFTATQPWAITQLVLLPDDEFAAVASARQRSLFDALDGHSVRIEGVTVLADLPLLIGRDSAAAEKVAPVLEIETSSMIRAEIRLFERTKWFETQVASLTGDHKIEEIYGDWPEQGSGTIDGVHYYLRVKRHAGLGFGDGDDEAVRTCQVRTALAQCSTYMVDFAGTPVAWQQLAYVTVWSIRQRSASSACTKRHEAMWPCAQCEIRPGPFVAQPKWELPKVNTDSAQREADIAAQAEIDRRWTSEVDAYLAARSSASTQFERDALCAAHRERMRLYNSPEMSHDF